MWNVKPKVIPIITGASETASKSFRKYLSNRTESTKSRNKSSHIGHCTHTSGSTDVKVGNVRHGKYNITCTINCKYRTIATLCTPETLFQAYHFKYRAEVVNNNNNNNNNNNKNRVLANRCVQHLQRVRPAGVSLKCV